MHQLQALVLETTMVSSVAHLLPVFFFLYFGLPEQLLKRHKARSILGWRCEIHIYIIFNK